jgi:NAD(P)-dependent dehydrogenase (short-subunit alcohol dehydrogenase family)
VVVLSGGAYGITYHLARSLVPHGCRLVFLGRTTLDPDIDFLELLGKEGDPKEVAAEAVRAAKSDLSGARLEEEISKVAKALQIVRNVEELRSLGIDAAYYSCDVADAQGTESVMADIVARYGKIDGIIHGAGILRDGFFKEMSVEDFSSVTDVKFLGAWNLYQGAKEKGLRFFVCLSSAAAIQGNPGQANYSAGNRIMSQLMTYLAKRDGSILSKALMLPPIEGTGMAEAPEIRAMMKRIKAAYVHVEELAGLFCRELFLGPSTDVWVLFLRSLPDLKTVLLDQSESSGEAGSSEVAAVSYKDEDFPMIDSITSVDLSRGELTASRDFSIEKDPWLADIPLRPNGAALLERACRPGSANRIATDSQSLR